MNVKELRIGNYVIDYGDGNVLQICSGRQIDVSDKHSGPIPITEEWLVKFGFKILEKTFYSFGNFDLYLTTDNDYAYLEYSSTRIKYVHQLQNLYFALTGEELTIQ